ncbi:TIGR02680 family protein [Paenibacillus sp. J5C_2022]|uniref:TIGR02680 family protein n=1 Tax=Paenibacillus sp. J5C2022 TaxID=2977129 RepID=UPI0021CFE5C3|nr:TIGR02680 family protein [Paenibacillus sp. J5C2022]MCU6708691.1 TIGR02680 family protein [Paenibacillus sp. J5C2022]
MDKRTTDAQASGRWMMNRVGILNFWYYDEEEFQLEDGRLILRGANGSGKSVTMQSFLPLVLDGDKRAHRLDPFGSRDRRIEFYLLGDDEGGKGKTDATGYLWMEFKHGTTGAYKTVGIGLRARRNAASVQFWGFLLEDGRRIGHDFWLYDHNRWLEEGVRMPLDRKELDGKMGNGGQVVQDQKSYQDMVNKHIFGFADVEAYQDLLQLMIQLRSPKLSKDFKPTAIYDILHEALPPLMEDELRPLSEVLEDMDQMTDRLDEIRRHYSEVVKLQERYDFYNKHILYSGSEELLHAKSSYDEVASRIKASQAAYAEAEEDQSAAASERDGISGRLQEIAAERELLEKHEAIGKQREYEAVQQALEDTEKQLERSRDKAERAYRKQQSLEREQGDASSRADASEREQRELLDEMEEMAGDMEFAGHAVYHRYWMPEVPSGDAWRESWRKDIRQHRAAVETALAKAVQAREAGAMAKEREIELGEASRLRDEAERVKGEREEQLEAMKERYRDEVVRWRSGLQLLQFGDEAVRETFGAVREYGPEQPSQEPIRETMLKQYAASREAMVEKRLGMERQRTSLIELRDGLQEEQRSWEQSREPEPTRSSARAEFRSRTGLGGAPLYEVCDFKADVHDEVRARIEDALERSGLLDAWIAPDGRVTECLHGDEEAWIVPRPVAFGYTLADMLAPVPSEESGLSAEAIDAVLRSFLWEEDGGEQGYEEWSGFVSADGSYRIGPLAGKAGVKPRAEYIGKETRKRTRLLEIARLADEIAAVESELAALESSLQQCRESEQRLQAERDEFPVGKELADGVRILQEAGYQLQAAFRQEELANERYKAKSEEWRALQRELYDLTAGWTRLKRERELSEAAAVIRDYEGAVSELHSAWRQYRDAHAAWQRHKTELESVMTEREDEEALSDELDERRRRQRAQRDTLKSLIEELGLADVARKLEELRSEQNSHLQQRKKLEERLEGARDRLSRAAAQLELLGEQADDREHRLRQAADLLWRELDRGLVGEWREVLQAIADRTLTSAAQGLAKEIRRAYEPVFAGRIAENIINRLLEQFTSARMLLTEYVLQTVEDEATGRILVLSMRNPNQPLPPQALLSELEQDEAQQSALLSERDRELYEEIILRSVGKAIRQRIHRAEQWVREMNRLMEERDTSSGLRLKLEWEPKPSSGEQQLDVLDLVELLKRDAHRLREDEIDAMIQHFRSQISGAKQSAQEEQESLRHHLYKVLDYRNWFRFELKYKKGEQTGYRPLTDARFNVLSGGEKAMAMYIPLFAATWSRYSDARHDAPRLISLDEAFAGVDEENMRDMFKLLTDMGFDYMMTSQVLWGCFDTVPKLAIYEIYRPKDVDFVTLFRYRWNGKRREYVESGAES